MTPERLGLLWGITVFAGAGARILSSLSGLPGVVLLLLSGLLIGRSGLGLVEPLDLGQGLETIVGLLVSLVLFDGGLNLRLPDDTIKSTVLRILLIRLVVSLAAGLLAAHWLAGLGWSVAAVYSAIVLATGPTVVTPLVQQIRLVSPLGDVLEAEGLVLEPVGAVLALLLLELLLGDLHGWREVAFGLLARLGGGVLMGAAAGWLLSEGLRRFKPDPSVGLRLQLTLGVLFLLYAVCEWLLPESGLPASVAAGVVVGRRPATQSDQLDELIRELARLAITMLFPLLAADVSWGELSPLGWGGVSCVLVLMLVVRPFAVSLATIGLPLDFRQRLFLGWLAPRGIVTAAVASLFAIRLEQAGILGAGRLQGLVFLTILMTVGIQGLTAQPLAKALGLIAPEDSNEEDCSETTTQPVQVLPDPGQ
ncbi:MAG: cation:proton antiporter [Prochlorococcus sp.]